MVKRHYLPRNDTTAGDATLLIGALSRLRAFYSNKPARVEASILNSTHAAIRPPGEAKEQVWATAPNIACRGPFTLHPDQHGLTVVLRSSMGDTCEVNLAALVELARRAAI